MTEPKSEDKPNSSEKKTNFFLNYNDPNVKNRKFKLLFSNELASKIESKHSIDAAQLVKLNLARATNTNQTTNTNQARFTALSFVQNISKTESVNPSSFKPKPPPPPKKIAKVKSIQSAGEIQPRSDEANQKSEQLLLENPDNNSQNLPALPPPAQGSNDANLLASPSEQPLLPNNGKTTISTDKISADNNNALIMNNNSNKSANDKDTAEKEETGFRFFIPKKEDPFANHPFIKYIKHLLITEPRLVAELVKIWVHQDE